MAKRKNPLKHLEDVQNMVYDSAVAMKATDLVGHARNPTALTGDVSGFLGIGITGAAMRSVRKRKRKCKRR